MKTVKYMIGITASLALVSCLDTDPETAISSEGVIVDETTAETVLVGAYSATQSFTGSTISLFNQASDNVVTFYAMGTVIPTPSAASFSGSYSSYYSAINVINQLVADIPTVSDAKFTGKSKNTKLAESLFLRALAYFDLAISYGGVPLVLEPSTSSHSADGIRRSSYEETLAQVESDLDRAEELFDGNLPTRARASLWAVYALKARLYLFQQKWDQAEQYASKLIDSKFFALTPEVKDWYENSLSSTSIFELVFSTADQNPIYTNSLPADLGGRLDYVPQGDLVQLLLDENIGGKRSQLIARQNAYSDQYVVQQFGKTDGSSSLVVFRLEEQYLIRAEARAQQGKLALAVEAINVIRNRAAVAPVDAETLSRQDILLVIENERRLELAFDGHRYKDIIRTGRAPEVFGAYNEAYKDPNYWVLPFPYSAITADPDLEQNPGY